MIHVFSRFTQAILIPSKHKDIIVQVILKYWVSIFGVPQSIFSDNGSEFHNHLLCDVAELPSWDMCHYYCKLVPMV